MLIELLAAAAFAAPPAGKWIDLTYPLDEATIFWPTEKGFSLEKGFAGKTDKGYYYAANAFSSPEHGGTHMDAPAHFHEGRQTVDQVPLERLVGEAVVVDVAAKCASNPDYEALTTDFIAWEAANGPIPPRSIVLIRTGWGKFWPDRKSYLGTDERDSEAVSKLHFPGLDPQAAKWLVSQRQARAVGIDTASIDYGQSTLYKSHVTLFEKNVPAFENVANLDELPYRGAFVIALPMKIKGGTGAPLRIVAIVPEKP